MRIDYRNGFGFAVLSVLLSELQWCLHQVEVYGLDFLTSGFKAFNPGDPRAIKQDARHGSRLCPLETWCYWQVHFISIVLESVCHIQHCWSWHLRHNHNRLSISSRDFATASLRKPYVWTSRAWQRNCQNPVWTWAKSHGSEMMESGRSKDDSCGKLVLSNRWQHSARKAGVMLNAHVPSQTFFLCKSDCCGHVCKSTLSSALSHACYCRKSPTGKSDVFGVREQRLIANLE